MKIKKYIKVRNRVTKWWKVIEVTNYTEKEIKEMYCDECFEILEYREKIIGEGKHYKTRKDIL